VSDDKKAIQDTVLEAITNGAYTRDKIAKVVRMKLGLKDDAWLGLDRVLRKLRAAKLISFQESRWVVGEVRTCPTCDGLGKVREIKKETPFEPPKDAVE
jgi:hypothetical protein